MAPSRYKDKDNGVVLSFNGQWVSWSHTAIAYCMDRLSLLGLVRQSHD
jgi:hypothetical protein